MTNVQAIVTAIALCVSGCLPCTAQETDTSSQKQFVHFDTASIHPSLPNFIFKSTTDGTYESYLTHKIEISTALDTIPFQVIKADALNEIGDISFFDINSDGYTDMRADGSPWELNTSCVFWLFDTVTHRFHRAEEFRFCNLRINEQSGIITSDGSSGNEGSTQTFQIINHHPKLIREESYGVDGEIIKTLVNGTLTATHTSTIEGNQGTDGKWYVCKIYQDYIFGELRVVLSTRALLIDGIPTKEQERNKFFVGGDRWTEASILLEKERFEYHLDEHGTPIYESTLEVVTNGAWMVKKKERRNVK